MAIHILTETHPHSYRYQGEAVGRLLSGVPFKHFTRAKNLIDAISEVFGGTLGGIQHIYNFHRCGLIQYIK
jgi:hypothetical protein